MRRVVLGLAATLIAVALLAAGCSSPSSSPAPSTSVPGSATSATASPPACAAGDQGDYWVPAGSDGDAGAVFVLGSGSRGIVLAPQSDGDICQWISYGRLLAGQGYRVAMFNWAQPPASALLGARQRLLDLGAAKIALVGASMGGAYVLGNAAELQPAAVVSFSGEASFDGLENDTLIRGYRGPLLLLGSEDDGYTPGDATRILARNHSGPEQVLVIPGSLHGVDLLVDSQISDAFAAFLHRYFPPN